MVRAKVKKEKGTPKKKITAKARKLVAKPAKPRKPVKKTKPVVGRKPVKLIRPKRKIAVAEISLPAKPIIKEEQPFKTDIDIAVVEKLEVKAPVSVPKPKEIELKLPITVKDLSIKLQEKPSVLIKILLDMKIMASINHSLDEKAVSVVCEKFGFKIKKAPDEEELALKIHVEKDLSDKLKPRSPIAVSYTHLTLPTIYSV